MSIEGPKFVAPRQPDEGEVSPARPEEEARIAELSATHDEVFIWEAIPGEVDDGPHTHAFPTDIEVLEGEISVEVEGETKVLHKGDSIHVPARAAHFTEVGPEGCRYIVAEMNH